MNQANDCGPLFSIWSRMIWINAGFPSGVFNVERSTLNVQRSTPERGTNSRVGCWTLSVGRLPRRLWHRFACSLRPTSTYLKPPPGYRFRRPWYLRPWFYIPGAILAVVALFLTVFVSSVVFDLKAQASAFDLNKLEQMESASVILDRNGKIFGQIYVENRETVPYEKLAPDLINAVIAVEDAKFYEHHGYDLLGIIRAALKNLTAGHVRQGGSTITQQLARNSF